MVKVNGAELYYAVRGSGPALLLIHGTGADSSCYDELAEGLARDFRVLTYDRRGWSRSPRPAGWVKTSIEEQADDAAWLLRATGHALALVLRNSDVVGGAILHEPSLFTTLPQDFVEREFAEFTPLINQAVASGGPRAGHEAFVGALAGASGLAAVADAERRERWFANSEFMFAYEFPAMLLGYRPDPAAITRVRVPMKVMRATESQPINTAAAEWLAAQLRTELLVAPGSHVAYSIDPDAFADALRPLLGEVAR
jgi:pimeloyl-ACP methyl ester carboxylesterase